MNTLGSGNSGLGDNLACLTKGPPMLVLTECRDVATISGENTESTMAETFGSGIRPQITPPMLRKIALLPPARIVKILEVREKLAWGTYDLDERLDAVLGRLLADINT
jgi:hypothetical protein